MIFMPGTHIDERTNQNRSIIDAAGQSYASTHDRSETDRSDRDRRAAWGGGRIRCNQIESIQTKRCKQGVKEKGKRSRGDEKKT